MMIFGAVFFLMLLAVVGMAIGVLTGRKSLQGSCGGLQTLQGVDCMVCPTSCEAESTPNDSCPHDQRKNRKSFKALRRHQNALMATSSDTQGASCN